MVGPMLLIRMMRCQRKSTYARKTEREELTTVGDGTSHTSLDGSALRNIVKQEKNEEICRICLKEGNIPIYGSSEGLHNDVSDYLNTFGGIEVSNDDPYPKFLCQSCNELLQGAILFRQTAQESDKHLRTPPPVNLVFVKNENTKLDFDDTDENNSFEYSGRKMRKRKTHNHCTKCNMTFNSLVSYNNHICITNESEKKTKELLKNKICKKLNMTGDIFEYKDPMSENHHSPETKTRKVRKLKSRCNKCNIKFNSFKEYREHRISEHKTNNQDDKSHVCPICNRSYHARYLPKHIATHETEASFMCDICGKKFVLQSTLYRHRTIHSNELPLECSLCPYKGRNNDLLKLHMRKHTGEKPYLCTECPSKFITKSNLNKHMRTHKATRDFKCDTCTRGFYTKRELETHYKANHLGIKEHICGTCGKAYGQRSIMLKHQLRVHKRKKMIPGITPVYLKVEAMKQQDQDFSNGS